MAWADIVDISARFRAPRLSRLALGGFTVCLAVATHIPNPETVQLIRFHAIDKVQHFVSYAILTALLLWALHSSGSLIWRRLGRLRLQTITVLTVVLLIGSVDELTQPWVGRTCSFNDLLADGLGATLSLSIAACLALANHVGLWSKFRSYEPLETL